MGSTIINAFTWQTLKFKIQSEYTAKYIADHLFQVNCSVVISGADELEHRFEFPLLFLYFCRGAKIKIVKSSLSLREG